MVDSGTIQFIASQEMARKQGQGGRAAWRARCPFSPWRGLINSIIPGSSRVHPVQVTASVQRTFFWSGRAGWDTERCQPGPEPGEERLRGIFWGKLGIIPPLVLQPLWSSQAWNACRWNRAVASISALHPRKKACNVQHGREWWLLTPWGHGKRKTWSLSLILTN